MADPDRSALDEARKRARRRLVGAVVLALTAAVVLPIFLETEPKPLGPDVQIAIPPIDDGKFQNRLTPEAKSTSKSADAGRLSAQALPIADGGRAQVADASRAQIADASRGQITDANRAQVSEASRAQVSEASRAQVAEAGRAQLPQTAAVSASQSASQPAQESGASSASGNAGTGTPGSGNAFASLPVSASASAPGGAASATAATGSTAPTLALAVSKSAPAAPAKAGAFVVQLGAFVGVPVAAELADKARDAGYPVFMEQVTVKTGQVHRVRVGPYGTKEEAQADAVKLKLAGFTADVRPK